jgi:hypothetical protein
VRILLIVLLSAAAIFAEDPQTNPSAGDVPNNLSIPAQLSQTVDTKKCKAGDAVEMRTLEPVLVTNGLVMPEHTKLTGKVISAASRKDDKPSWLLLVIKRAEWKDHSVPLRAFIISQITVKTTVDAPNDSAFQGALTLPENVLRRRSRTQDYPRSELSVSAAHPLHDGTVESGESQQLTYQRLDDVRLLPGKNGIVFLLSAKDHLKLPSGTMFMLRNRVAPQTEAPTRQAPVENPTGTTH